MFFCCFFLLYLSGDLALLLVSKDPMVMWLVCVGGGLQGENPDCVGPIGLPT